MARMRVGGFGVSVDGYGAGPNQSLENPHGIGGLGLHEWMFPTRTFQRMSGKDGGTTGIDDDFAAGDSKILEHELSAGTCLDPCEGRGGC